MATSGDKLSREKLELLQSRLLGGADSARTATITRRAYSSPIPLSFAQERLWFLERYAPGSPVYHVPLLLRLTGPLDVDSLQRALDEVVARHEALRACFVLVDAAPAQVVARPAPVPLGLTDLTGFPRDEREERALAFAAEEVERPFDLEAGPPLRMQLMRLADDEHLLALVVHHIACDGWSMGVLLRDLAELYEAFAAGWQSPLREPELQYGDYAVWQRDRLSGDTLERQLAYWTARLADMPVLELSLDRGRPRTSTYRCRTASVVLSPTLPRELRRLAQSERVTLFTTLLGAFQVLLARHCGQDEVVIGTPVANRELPELEGVVGLFLNMLVLRTDLSGNPPFREALRRVQHVSLDAYANQDLPFERLVAELQPRRTASRPPLFDVVVNLNPPRPDMEVGALRWSGIDLEDAYSAYAMTLYVRDQKETIELDLVYQRDLLTAERVALLLEQLEHLLVQAVADPAAPILSYSLVTSASQSVLPNPRTPMPAPRYAPVTEEFMEHASRAPSASAMRRGGRVWTYRDLAERSRNIAQQLIAGGLRPGDVVAVGGEPGFGLIASFLAVLLARGVVLPLDRTLPVERQRLMLSVSGAGSLLFAGEPGDAVELLEGLALQTVFVSPDSACSDGLPATARDLPLVDPDDPAYIYFTSGSTGVPKGVLGRHNALSHLLAWERETFEVGSSDRCGLTTRLSFDAVLRDILLPLTSGGTLCIPDDEQLVLDGPRVLRWLDEERISLLHIVPALGQRWLDSRPPDIGLAALRCTFFAGEPLTEGLVCGWRDAFPDSAVFNWYGTTETMVRCFHPIPREPAPGVQPVGRPLPHTQALVINDAGVPSGVGELGEVVLRSPVRTFGYINAPNEQKAKFVPNPFGGDEGDSCYRTGDTGRFRPDGTLEILGRRDDQVKIRGVRVEPVEVQAVLGMHPRVAAAAVVARSDTGETTLVAYFVPKFSDALAPAELRAYLAERLPDAMVPGAIVALDALPLLANGKVDKAALPPPDVARDEVEYVEPRAGIEASIAVIWSEVLGVERVGSRDNFFDLGGHSLKVVDVVARIREAFGIDLPLRILFEQPTMESVAREVEKRQREEASASTVPEELLQLARDDEQSLTSLIAALEQLEREDVRPNADAAVLAERPDGMIDHEEVET